MKEREIQTVKESKRKRKIKRQEVWVPLLL
jgi:hypothetical protein